MSQTAARHMAEPLFGTATCTVCWRGYSLTRAGNLRSHNRPDAAWNPYAGMCEGARKPPGAVMRTTAVDLRGHRDHYGPGLAADGLTLENAPHIKYCGRSQSQGGWRLRRSPFANPFSAQRAGGAQKAVALFRDWFAAQPDLVELARAELRGRALGCWCSNPLFCHTGVVAEAADSTGIWPAPVAHARGDGYASRTAPPRFTETVRPAGEMAGLL